MVDDSNYFLQCHVCGDSRNSLDMDGKVCIECGEGKYHRMKILTRKDRLIKNRTCIKHDVIHKTYNEKLACRRSKAYGISYKQALEEVQLGKGEPWRK